MAPPARPPPGLHFDPGFLTARDRSAIAAWLATSHPIREQRFSDLRPPPRGQDQRPLLRPVIWLGGWQFACLDYYHPPDGALGRVVRADPYPPALQTVVDRAEARIRSQFRGPDLPKRWRLNTCLVNLYGSWVGDDGKRTDTARVGDHRDYEPGPIASISLGERGLFQFVTPGGRREPVKQVWLTDGSLVTFGGPYWKDRVLHRVQRVDHTGRRLDVPYPGFETRRVNITFRWVPEEHIAEFASLPLSSRDDVRGYVAELARQSPHWEAALRAEAATPAQRPE